MWNKDWREKIWDELDKPWDVIVVGGGITGAGVLRQAVNAGLNTLLLEAGDFASGTSSRSSKLVHGGFRYLRNKQYSVTRESVREREWLLREASHLVTPLPFLLPDYESYRISMKEFGLGVAIYDLLAPKWKHARLTPQQMGAVSPELRQEGLLGGFLYSDAAMDDSRIVLRIIREAVRTGGTAVNYARVETLLKDPSGQVCGVAVKDVSRPDGPTLKLKAHVVINATGPWSDELRTQVGGARHIRKLRGSHLIFDRARLPLPQAITIIHPRDRRALFALPWEGTSVVGTTDLDHAPELERENAEPFATTGEVDYLLEAANFLFPHLSLTRADILSSFAGVRPTIKVDADADPSKVSRAHAIYLEQGLITITGGKYTTFRIMSRQAVNAALQQMGKPQLKRRRIFDRLPKLEPVTGLDSCDLLYLAGRHGADTSSMLAIAQPEELEHIDSLPNIWAEVRWAAREEGVQHLDDLLLRRVRLGMLLPNGAVEHLPHIRAIVQSELGWDDTRWQKEETAYRATWRRYYSPEPDKAVKEDTK